MSEVLFYHLTEKTLAQTLPGLLEKCEAKGWRSVVQVGNQTTLDVLDMVLWKYKPDSFMAHSKIDDDTAKDQPIWLTLNEKNPNGAQIRFMVDMVEGDTSPPDLTDYERGVYIFDGHNEAALGHARARWKVEKSAGHEVTYWQQNSNGSWEKKA